MSMYLCDAPCPSNEELARHIQEGDPEAASLLLSQNEGYLTMLATSYCEQFSQEYLVDDLKQEGALALLEAAQRFDPSRGTKLLTYATSAIETAMQDFAAQSSCPLSFPAERYQQLRQVAFLCAAHEQENRRRASRCNPEKAIGLCPGGQTDAGGIPHLFPHGILGRPCL